MEKFYFKAAAREADRMEREASGLGDSRTGSPGAPVEAEFPTDDVDEKYRRLQGCIAEMGSLMVAFSAGVDSTLVAKVAFDVLGDRAMAVTGRSPSIPARELEDARRVAGEIGIRHVVIATEEIEQEAYASNPSNRCYFCKSELYEKLFPLAEAHGMAGIADGSNADDVGDFRPGMKAARRRGVKSPLQDVALTKVEVRALARNLGLSNWNKPAAACLSSRIPYGTRVTAERLKQVEAAEEVLRALGFSQVRVRHHERVARIEVPPDQMAAVLACAQDVLEGVKGVGFSFVALDLKGYRSGSLNEALPMAAGEGR